MRVVPIRERCYADGLGYVSSRRHGSPRACRREAAIVLKCTALSVTGAAGDRLGSAEHDSHRVSIIQRVQGAPPCYRKIVNEASIHLIEVFEILSLGETEGRQSIYMSVST